MISLSYYYFISIQLKYTDASRCNTVLYLFFVSHYTVYLTLFTEDVNLIHPCLCIILINQIILYKFPLSILISTDNIHPLNYMSPGNFSVRLGKQTHRMSDRCMWGFIFVTPQRGVQQKRILDRLTLESWNQTTKIQTEVIQAASSDKDIRGFPSNVALFTRQWRR